MITEWGWQSINGTRIYISWLLQFITKWSQTILLLYQELPITVEVYNDVLSLLEGYTDKNMPPVDYLQCNVNKFLSKVSIYTIYILNMKRSNSQSFNVELKIRLYPTLILLYSTLILTNCKKIQIVKNTSFLNIGRPLNLCTSSFI